MENLALYKPTQNQADIILSTCDEIGIFICNYLRKQIENNAIESNKFCNITYSLGSVSNDSSVDRKILKSKGFEVLEFDEFLIKIISK